MVCLYADTLICIKDKDVSVKKFQKYKKSIYYTSCIGIFLMTNILVT